ncbi:hypothetical protein CK203_090616 [Vitis vinifera]|uniref:Endonuclease/exonuclease/phosphatase domain-containing protein n=1 Tax=Vitis vinifera TaxID=29760 RepID=A0A438DVY8_VITVI|nr:hypothetical protein CK203_090616 [Vitis vinifera]
MTDGMVKSLGVGRFLDWRTIEAAGGSGRRSDLLGQEVFGAVERIGSAFGGIGAIRGLWGEPWCVGGDFNVILSQGERSRQGRISPTMRRFAQGYERLELVDLPLQGGTFTWSGGLQNQAWARLDRFMVSPSWLDQFRNVTQKRLSRPISDHFPIIIEGGGIKRGPVPFRFENMWLKVEGFKDLLRSWWQGMSVSGRASYRLATKLKVIKQNFKEEELSRRKEVKDDYAKWVRLEEIHWRQLSRELWLREGDRNTGYFHRMANAHRRRQSMDKIKINGVWLSEEQDVKNGIVDAFQRLLTEDSEWKADIGGLDLNQISQQEADTLELPFTEEEVHLALMGMNGDKAPGPDGFTGAFWQFCWEFVKEEILEMFKGVP